MFGKEKVSVSSAKSSTTLVSKTTKITGDVDFFGDLMVEGTIKGKIYSEDGAEAFAQVMEKGLVEGEIRVPTLVINGTINGNVYSDKHIELAGKAVVNGDVHYNFIEIAKGAQVNGNLVYVSKSGGKTSAPSAAKVAADNKPKILPATR
jgi:cytoskeletal protein CcmA (bactofilin family)